MKKQISISIIAIIILFSLFLIIKPSLTGYSIYQTEEKIRLGYCPTMQEEAISLSEKNDYELINLGSASEVLFTLKNNQIDKALIGRKAEQSEINPNTKEKIINSGYTLVSNKKSFVDYSQLSSLEVYSHLETDNLNFKTIDISEEEVLAKIKEGKIILIPWEDWNDDFELFVVMNGNKKVKEFRGVFLYE